MRGFPYAPINSDRLYVMEKDSSGCEIYLPVEKVSDVHTQKMKSYLRVFLDSQPSYVPPDKPRLA